MHIQASGHIRAWATPVGAGHGKVRRADLNVHPVSSPTARQVYVNAMRGGPVYGIDRYSEEDNKIAAERLRKLIDYHISKLSDEDKEWVDTVK